MARLPRQTATFWIAGALCAAIAAVNCARSTNLGSADDEGHVTLALSVPGGFTVNSVTYVVKSSTGATVLGPASFDVSDPNATPSLDLVLPPATGDTVTLSATATNNHAFTGTSAPFNVVSGQTTLVNVTLTDTVAAATPPGTVLVNGTIVANDNPPVIDSVVVAAAQISVNGSIGVSVAAHDPDSGDVLSYAWTATPDGTFTAATAATTSFKSATPGTKTLRITVSDNRTPAASTFVDLPVNVIGVATGTGGTGGVAGTGGSTGGTGGSAAGTGGATGGTGGVAGTGGATGGTGGTAGTGGSTGGTGGVAGTGGSTGGTAGSSAGSGGATGGTGGTAAGTGGATGGTGGVAGTGGTGGTTAGTGGTGGSPVDTYAALQNAELATDFDPSLLTFTHDVDPDTGDSTAVGWGPRTLPTQAQRDAATALIRKIATLLPGSVRNSSNSANYAPPGLAFPALGLLTLGADPGGLISGTNLAPAATTAWAEFKAAAVADAAAGAPSAAVPGGISASAADGTVGSYIATYAVNPSSAIGIAVNVVSAAVQNGLTAQLQAF